MYCRQRHTDQRMMEQTQHTGTELVDNLYDLCQETEYEWYSDFAIQATYKLQYKLT